MSSSFSFWGFFSLLDLQGFISSTWNQTGTVTGRLSAKHPVSEPIKRFTF